MNDAVHVTVVPGSDPHASESSKALPHAYIVEEARLKQAASTLYHVAAHHTQPEEFQSSACFDAWAKDGEDA